jgi:hypothetical protein
METNREKSGNDDGRKMQYSRKAIFVNLAGILALSVVILVINYETLRSVQQALTTCVANPAGLSSCSSSSLPGILTDAMDGSWLVLAFTIPLIVLSSILATNVLRTRRK